MRRNYALVPNIGYLFKALQSDYGNIGVLEWHFVDGPDIYLSFGVKLNGTLSVPMCHNTMTGFTPVADKVKQGSRFRGMYSVLGDSVLICVVHYKRDKKTGIHLKTMELYMPDGLITYHKEPYVKCRRLTTVTDTWSVLTDTATLFMYKNKIQDQLRQMDIEDKDAFILQRSGVDMRESKTYH